MTFSAPTTWMFLDLETTGLSPDAPNAAILESGMLAVAVPSFHEVDSWSSVILELDRLEDPLKGADDFVRDMHTKNGLKADLDAAIVASPPAAAGAPLPRLFDVQQAALKFYNLHCSGTRAYLGGANPDFDRRWLERHMPQLAKKFHYRPFDTNAFFQLREALFGPQEKSGQRHRVLDDCRAAVGMVHQHFDLMRQLFGRTA